MKKHILTIDDEAEVRELLQQILTTSGYQVTTAASAAEARRVLQAGRPDLIITDLQLEDADGLVFVDEVKATYPDVPVILLTGVLFDPHVVQETIGKKVSCYIEKTAPLTRILSEIRQLTGG